MCFYKTILSIFKIKIEECYLFSSKYKVKATIYILDQKIDVSWSTSVFKCYHIKKCGNMLEMILHYKWLRSPLRIGPRSKFYFTIRKVRSDQENIAQWIVRGGPKLYYWYDLLQFPSTYEVYNKLLVRTLAISIHLCSLAQ